MRHVYQRYPDGFDIATGKSPLHAHAHAESWQVEFQPSLGIRHLWVLKKAQFSRRISPK